MIAEDEQLPRRHDDRLLGGPWHSHPWIQEEESLGVDWREWVAKR